MADDKEDAEGLGNGGPFSLSLGFPDMHFQTPSITQTLGFDGQSSQIFRLSAAKNSLKVVGKERWEEWGVFRTRSHLLCRRFRALIFLSFASRTPGPHCDCCIQSMKCYFRPFLKSPIKNTE